MFHLNKFIILQILNILSSNAITNKDNTNEFNLKVLKPAAAGTGIFYLNKERPLWILQDVSQDKVLVKKPLKEKLKYKDRLLLKPDGRHQQQQFDGLNKVNKKFYRNSKNKQPKHFQNQRFTKGLQLPSNYIPFRKSKAKTSFARYKNSKFLRNLPVFDAVPGEETPSSTTPIFIYNGQKGRLLVNTMLSEHKYPMQEPVPGQILHPPTAVLFKPQVLVENFKEKLNVTMIPFYAYEARAADKPFKPAKPSRNSKTAKQYKAFYSPQEVLAVTTPPFASTTSLPLTLETPYTNHRFNEVVTTTTALPHKKFEINYSDGEDKFQITYEDEATTTYLERPLTAQTTTVAPVPYDSYTFDKNYYAFPVYTMAKLLEKDYKSISHKASENITAEQQQQMEKYENAGHLSGETNKTQQAEKEQEQDTWFILNTRYKGPLKTNTTNHNLHSSKYIQSSAVRQQNGVMDFMAKKAKAKKARLQAQKRSLYSEHLNFVLK